MADLYRGYDAFWWGEVMGPQTTFDAQRLRIRVDGDIYEAELDDEIYTTTGGTGHADLFSALEQKLTLQIPGAFFWVERTDLTGVDGTIRRGWGTRLRCTQPFSLIRSTSVGSRRLLESLGFDDGVTEFPSVPWSGYYIIDSPRPWGLCWRTPRKADRKLSTIIHEQSTSGGSGQSIQLTRWGTDQI